MNLKRISLLLVLVLVIVGFVFAAGGMQDSITPTSPSAMPLPPLYSNDAEREKALQNELNRANKGYAEGDIGPGGGRVFFSGFNNTSIYECSNDLGGEYNWNDAMRVARNYRGGGFTDWKLPSIGMLQYLNNNSFRYGLRINNGYWSSTEAETIVVNERLSYECAYSIFVNNRNNFSSLKTELSRVVAVRQIR